MDICKEEDWTPFDMDDARRMDFFKEIGDTRIDELISGWRKSGLGQYGDTFWDSFFENWKKEQESQKKNMDDWVPFDPTEGDMRIEIFSEIGRNPRLCELLRKWHDTKRERYGKALWHVLFEGWKQPGEGR